MRCVIWLDFDGGWYGVEGNYIADLQLPSGYLVATLIYGKSPEEARSAAMNWAAGMNRTITEWVVQ